MIRVGSCRLGFVGVRSCNRDARNKQKTTNIKAKTEYQAEAAKYDLSVELALIEQGDVVIANANITYFESQFARALGKASMDESKASAEKYMERVTPEIYEKVIPQFKIAIDKLVDK